MYMYILKAYVWEGGGPRGVCNCTTCTGWAYLDVNTCTYMYVYPSYFPYSVHVHVVNHGIFSSDAMNNSPERTL